jgi:REP element-mobilizing transposase RayT
LHHVRFRGIERCKIFIDNRDREDFLERLGNACSEGRAIVYAWCLMGNHVHLAIRTGSRPLKKTMSSLLTGYAQSFNRRHARSGHLMQNRFKSTVVEEERYFLALVRYIHLNPVRARMVSSLEELAQYPWSGHSVLMGKQKASFQEKDEVLLRFGKKAGIARQELVRFMGDAEARRDGKVFGGAGGGLVRSIGGLSELGEHRRGPKWAYDERILGSGEFVTKVLEQSGEEGLEMIASEDQRRAAYEELARRVSAQLDVDVGELFSGSRRREVARARQIVSYVATRKLGVQTQTVARTMKVSSPAIVAAARKGPETMTGLGMTVEDFLSESNKAGKLIK